MALLQQAYIKNATSSSWSTYSKMSFSRIQEPFSPPVALQALFTKLLTMTTNEEELLVRDTNHQEFGWSTFVGLCEILEDEVASALGIFGELDEDDDLHLRFGFECLMLYLTCCFCILFLYKTMKGFNLLEYSK